MEQNKENQFSDISHKMEIQLQKGSNELLNQIKNFHAKLHLFKNLTHRTECFYIKSYCEDIKCTMTVCRTLGDNAKKIWKVQNIQLTINNDF